MIVHFILNTVFRVQVYICEQLGQLRSVETSVYLNKLRAQFVLPAKTRM